MYICSTVSLKFTNSTKLLMHFIYKNSQQNYDTLKFTTTKIKTDTHHTQSFYGNYTGQSVEW